MGFFEQIRKYLTEPRPFALLEGPDPTRTYAAISVGLTAEEAEVADAIMSHIRPAAARYERYAAARNARAARAVRIGGLVSRGVVVVKGNGGIGSSDLVSPANIPSEGLKVGELIGWRAWVPVQLAEGGWSLASCFMGTIWEPGAAMKGDPKQHGVHAWKSMTAAIAYAQEQPFCVIGSISLWGEVVEHECGYRAEFGKPKSLDAFVHMAVHRRVLLVGTVNNGVNTFRSQGVGIALPDDPEAMLTDLRKRYLRLSAKYGDA